MNAEPPVAPRGDAPRHAAVPPSTAEAPVIPTIPVGAVPPSQISNMPPMAESHPTTSANQVVGSSSLGVVVGDRYRLDRVVGSGGMATVYAAVDLTSGEEVAVKLYRSGSTSTEDALRQEREIRLLGSLTHPSIIGFHAAGEHRGSFESRRYVVMELMAEPPLEERLRLGQMPEFEVAAIGAQLAGALAHVHERGIVHRDIKPANILISDVGSSGFRRTAKLTDFGVARFVDASRMTADGTVMGTAAYLSPEQVSGEDVTVQSDVYSLGLVLLECLTGYREYTGTVVEAAVARLQREPRIPGDLAPEWRVLLAAMTARNPADRPTAADIARTLRGEPEPNAAAKEHGRRAAGEERRGILGSRRTDLVALGVASLALVAVWGSVLLLVVNR